MCAGVAGGTASGKTSVCTRIIEQLRREIAVCTLLPCFLALAANCITAARPFLLRSTQRTADCCLTCWLLPEQWV